MGEKTKPLSPDEVLEKKQASIPDEMLEAVNEMIVKKWNGSEATFKQEDVLDLYFLKKGENNIQKNRDKVFDNHWMDFEDIYRKAGWGVSYDKPAYNESYPATFTFKKKARKNDE
jgi:hypothetical protein